MNTEPEMLTFVKAMASAERLRVIGALVRGRATQAEIAEQLHVPVRDVFQHLSYLAHVGVVSEADGVYDLNEKAIESSSADTMRPRIPAVDRLSPSIILPERVVSPCENTPSPIHER